MRGESPELWTLPSTFSSSKQSSTAPRVKALPIYYLWYPFLASSCILMLEAVSICPLLSII